MTYVIELKTKENANEQSIVANSHTIFQLLTT